MTNKLLKKSGILFLEKHLSSAVVDGFNSPYFDEFEGTIHALVNDELDLDYGPEDPFKLEYSEHTYKIASNRVLKEYAKWFQYKRDLILKALGANED